MAAQVTIISSDGSAQGVPAAPARSEPTLGTKPWTGHDVRHVKTAASKGRDVVRRRTSLFASRRTLGPERLGTLVTRRTIQSGSPGQGSFSTWANLTSVLIGGGLLQMGNAFKMSGFSALVVTVVLSSMCAWTMVLIARCLQRAEEVVPEEEREDEPVDWPLIGQAALGRPGKMFVGAIFLADLLMSILTFQVLCGSTLKVIFPQISLTILICASGALTLLMLLVPEERLSVASSAGIVATLVFLVAVIVSGACMDERPDPSTYEIFDLKGVPGAISIVVFSMVAHAEAPTIYQPLEDKSQFGKISAGSFSVAITMYAAVGLFGYWAYAQDVHPNLLDNLGLNLEGSVVHGLGWLRNLAAALFAAKLQVVQPILLTPVATMLDLAIVNLWASRARGSGRALRGESGKDESGSSDDEDSEGSTGLGDSADDDEAGARRRSSGEQDISSADEVEEEPPRASALLSFATRAISTVVFVIIAVVMQDHLEMLTEVTGSFCSLSVAVTFPVFFYLKLYWQELGVASRVFLAVVGVAGVAMQILGTIQAVVEVLAK